MEYDDVSTWKSHLWKLLQLWYAIRSKVKKMVCLKIFLASMCWVKFYKSVQHIPPYTCLFYRVLNTWNRFSSAIIQKQHNISWELIIVDYQVVQTCLRSSFKNDIAIIRCELVPTSKRATKHDIGSCHKLRRAHSNSQIRTLYLTMELKKIRWYKNKNQEHVRNSAQRKLAKHTHRTRPWVLSKPALPIVKQTFMYILQEGKPAWQYVSMGHCLNTQAFTLSPEKNSKSHKYFT